MCLQRKEKSIQNGINKKQQQQQTSHRVHKPLPLGLHLELSEVNDYLNAT